MQKILLVAIITGILYHLITVTSSCATEPQKAEILPKTLNNSFDFLCDSECNGSLIFERQNSSTDQYNMIREQPYNMYIATFNISQYSDGGKHRCRCNYTSEYCYLNVQVVPTKVKMNFTQGTLNEWYVGMCSAEGNPRPRIHAKLISNGCNYTMTKHNISDFTSQVRFTIQRVTEQCQNATISCEVHQMQETTQLNVVRSDHVENGPASNNPCNNHTGDNTTMDERPLPAPPSDDGGRGTSTTHNGSSQTMILLTGIMAAVYLL